MAIPLRIFIALFLLVTLSPARSAGLDAISEIFSMPESSHCTNWSGEVEPSRATMVQPSASAQMLRAQDSA